MACLGRGGDWIVPRRLMCFLFWTGTLLLFAGILLVVTSKHKGEVFLSWGGVLLGLGSCVLLVCLVLCIHAYYVIAESRNSAEHSFLDHLQLQRKAQYSVPPSSSDIWEPKVDSFPDVAGSDARTYVNGRYSTSEFRQATVPVENGIHARYQSVPSERKGEENKVVFGGEKGGTKEAEFGVVTRPTAESKGEDGTSNRTSREKVVFSSPSIHDLLPPPPSYSSQVSPQSVYSSSSTASKIVDSSSLPSHVVVSPMQTSISRPESRELEKKSSRTTCTSTPPHPKKIPPASPVSRATRDDHLRHHPPPHQIPDFRNTSSQSSAPNSSTEFEPETTDLEISHALRSSPSGRRKEPHRETRLLNNTPVDSYQTDAAVPGADSVLARRPPMLNFKPLTYDSDSYVDRLDKGETAAAGPWRMTSTLPSGSGADVWASEPHQAGPRRPPGAASITRPFGHGSVTVTPLYRTPKTPPSGRQKTAVAGVTVRSPEATRNVDPPGTAVKSPELGRGGTPAAVSVRNPEEQRAGSFGRRPVPTVSVTPCIADRETDIGVCQSDVTVYDNVIDTVKM